MGQPADIKLPCRHKAIIAIIFMRPVRFVMIDGIDGSGKSTVFTLFKKKLISQNRTIFDLTTAIKTSGRIPLFEELPETEFILSAEPTHAWVGAAIREEIIRKDAGYGVGYAIEAFALDRAILYKRVLIPALKAGRKIIQDRGFTSSLAYQSVQGNMSMQEILNLPGNTLANQYAPDLFIHVDCPVEVTLGRLKKRLKQDDSLFERRQMLEKIQKAFSSNEFFSLLSQNTERFYLSTDCPLEDVRSEMQKLIKRFD